ncbi:2-hydroxyacid dehydrogenase [Cocleimonas sp. KMM 6892]|uniref:2-hydroxyacid dehydrogenase n=1 Tax=unclassified Cocleimonas TaxID=2639732 RepID=UPI002DBA57A3|nr:MULTISPECIES: 2-hydroxyacid dehydrogenase [unclassified Cocleimonas]MEB8432683.1 2-hydroxyacid dehydrogenase [Cocleimonas sp. KMM 6892]MEC4715542.1 2-hydroxyacid dehydrogenase [Cocleimonas sp. KMM 6895]MEC4744840.1 2-hydroxyacid dehydrogenase [Cocleimonas sp. KMM 6896]
MQNLFVTGKITPAMEEQLSTAFSLQFAYDLDDPASWLQTHGESFKYVLTSGHEGIKPEFMDALPNLELISNYSVGYDSINIPLIKEKGILVTHTPNVLNAETSTTALLLLLACYRDFIFNEAHARSGRWEQGKAPLSRTADNRTIGIIGLGRIGQAIADKLTPFNTRILYHGRSKKDVPYEYFPKLIDMAQEADAMICITTGGPETKHLVNREVMEALGPEGVLVNVSRGSVVDESAMIDCLENGKLGWAGLDVFENEPVIPKRLRDLKNTVLTPHIGSATQETRTAMGNLAVENLLQHLREGTVLTPIPECVES